MSTYFKIQELWNYLRIQDEVLLIQVYNPATRSDELVVVEQGDQVLKISTVDSLEKFDKTRPFRLIQQRDNDGKHIIPDVAQLIADAKLDY